MFLLMGGVVCHLSGTLVFPVKLFRLSLGGIAVLFSCDTRSVTVHLELEFHAVWSRSQGSFCPIKTRWAQGCPWRLSPQHWEGAVAVLSSFYVGSPLFAWLWLGTLHSWSSFLTPFHIPTNFRDSLSFFRQAHNIFSWGFDWNSALSLAVQTVLSVSTYFGFFHLFYIFLIEVIDLH